MRTRIINPYKFAERLEDFHEYTDEAIVEIAHDSCTPAFLNDEIIYRRLMGKRAIELAVQIRKSYAETPDFTEADIEAVDIDAELSGLLGDSDEEIGSED